MLAGVIENHEPQSYSPRSAYGIGYFTDRTNSAVANSSGWRSLDRS